jgi:hypothetical protein
MSLSWKVEGTFFIMFLDIAAVMELLPYIKPAPPRNLELTFLLQLKLP